MLKALLFVAPIAILLGAATEPAAPGSSLRADDARVATMAYRISTAGVAHCPERQPATGLLFHHLADYDTGDRAGMVSRYGLDRGPGILTVVEGSSAARAGLAAGDVILSIDGQPIEPAGPGRVGRDALEDRLEDSFRAGPVEIAILRAGERRSIRFAPEPACPSRVRLARSDQVNGFASPRRVVLTTALLAETQNNDELAVVLGHELAHVVLKHPEQLAAEGVPRGLLRGFGRNAERVHQTEQEADRLGLMLAHAAGYDVRAALPFWRRFYARYDGPQLFRTHPSLALRERIIAETLAELEAGAQRPELREGALRQR